MTTGKKSGLAIMVGFGCGFAALCSLYYAFSAVPPILTAPSAT
jgi:hypothetical protein